MAGAVFDVFCLSLGDGMSRTDLLSPIRSLFESSSARRTRAVRCEGFASQPALPTVRKLGFYESAIQNSAPLTTQKKFWGRLEKLAYFAHSGLLKKSHYTKKRHKGVRVR